MDNEQNQTAALAVTDAAAEAVAVAPRVSLAEIEANIAAVYYTDADRALSHEVVEPEHVKPLQLLTICFVVMKNGYTVVGKSAPASPEHITNWQLGRKLAYEDAVRQVWPLMGFVLRERLSAAPHSRL
jgi:hypothetical protein